VKKYFDFVGYDDLLEAVRSFPTTLDYEPAYREAADFLAEKLKENTPKGYNRKLPDSVITVVTAAGAEVGYERGVETAGDRSLDSVTRPRTRGQSVLSRWVSADQLSSILEQTYDDFADESVRIFADGIAREMAQGPD
jgi:hypothetical protein